MTPFDEGSASLSYVKLATTLATDRHPWPRRNSNL